MLLHGLRNNALGETPADFAQRRLRCSVRSPSDRHGIPASSNSAFMCPAPSPSSRRPSVSRSAVTASRTSSAGFQKHAFSTYVRSLIRRVTMPAATSAANGAAMPRWSGAARKSKPSPSARSAAAANSARERQGRCPRPNLTAASWRRRAGRRPVERSARTSPSDRSEAREAPSRERRRQPRAGHPEVLPTVERCDESSAPHVRAIGAARASASAPRRESDRPIMLTAPDQTAASGARRSDED
jgi:hypothetical protein